MTLAISEIGAGRNMAIAIKEVIVDHSNHQIVEANELILIHSANEFNLKQ